MANIRINGKGIEYQHAEKGNILLYEVRDGTLLGYIEHKNIGKLQLDKLYKLDSLIFAVDYKIGPAKIFKIKRKLSFPPFSLLK